MEMVCFVSFVRPITISVLVVFVLGFRPLIGHCTHKQAVAACLENTLVPHRSVPLNPTDLYMFPRCLETASHPKNQMRRASLLIDLKSKKVCHREDRGRFASRG